MARQIIDGDIVAPYGGDVDESFEGFEVFYDGCWPSDEVSPDDLEDERLTSYLTALVISLDDDGLIRTSDGATHTSGVLATEAAERQYQGGNLNYGICHPCCSIRR